VIELEALSKRFGAIDAVRDVSFRAADGRISVGSLALRRKTQPRGGSSSNFSMELAA